MGFEPIRFKCTSKAITSRRCNASNSLPSNIDCTAMSKCAPKCQGSWAVLNIGEHIIQFRYLAAPRVADFSRREACERKTVPVQEWASPSEAVTSVKPSVLVHSKSESSRLRWGDGSQADSLVRIQLGEWCLSWMVPLSETCWFVGCRRKVR